MKTDTKLDKKGVMKALENLKPELEKLGVTEIGLFGSYVREEQNEDSDIDILIDFKPIKEKFDNFMKAYDLLEDSFKDKKVEIVTRNGLSPYIGPNILNTVEYV